MKKIICLILFFVFLMPLCAFADILPYKIYACSTEKINTSQIKEGEYLTFLTIGQYEIAENKYIEENAIVKVIIKKYVKPKRGKRNGYAKIELVEYSIPSKDNEIINISNKNITGTLKLSSPLDKKEIIKNASVAVTGHFLEIPGFSQAIAISKGLINPNPEQNRLQSAGTNLYESTPFTYVEKGNDLEIEENAIVVLKIKNNENY
ncbi:MAG: hypothetical protein ACI37R_08585 [Candidatus Avigastranaerophilus sp.]